MPLPSPFHTTLVLFYTGVSSYRFVFSEFDLEKHSMESQSCSMGGSMSCLACIILLGYFFKGKYRLKWGGGRHRTDTLGWVMLSQVMKQQQLKRMQLGSSS